METRFTGNPILGWAESHKAECIASHLANQFRTALRRTSIATCRTGCLLSALFRPIASGSCWPYGAVIFPFFADAQSERSVEKQWRLPLYGIMQREPLWNCDCLRDCLRPASTAAASGSRVFRAHDRTTIRQFRPVTIIGVAKNYRQPYTRILFFM